MSCLIVWVFLHINEQMCGYICSIFEKCNIGSQVIIKNIVSKKSCYCLSESKHKKSGYWKHAGVSFITESYSTSIKKKKKKAKEFFFLNLWSIWQYTPWVAVCTASCNTLPHYLSVKLVQYTLRVAACTACAIHTLGSGLHSFVQYTPWVAACTVLCNTHPG